MGETKKKISSGATFVILNWRLTETDSYTFSLSAVNPGPLSHTSPLCPCSAYKQLGGKKIDMYCARRVINISTCEKHFSGLYTLGWRTHTRPRKSVLCLLNYSISDYLITPQTREPPSSWHARREIRTLLQRDWRFVRELRKKKTSLKKPPKHSHSPQTSGWWIRKNKKWHTAWQHDAGGASLSAANLPLC